MRIRTVWLVARREFLVTVARPGFLVTLLALPVTHLLLAGLLGLSLRTAARETQKEPDVILVDPSGLLPSGGAIMRETQPALEAIRNGTLDAAVVLSDDYLESGRVSSFARPTRGFVDLGKRLQQRQRASTIIQEGLTAGRFQALERQRLIQPIQSVESFRLSGNTFVAESPFAIVSALTGPFGVCFLLGLAVFLASGNLHHAATAEVSNRMLEMMLCLVRPVELLAGKVAGLGAAGIVQIGAYFGIALLMMRNIPGTVELPLAVALWSTAFFIGGYVLFAVLLAAIGVLAREQQDSMNFASILMLAAAVPFFFVLQFDGEPAAGIVAALSWIPLTAPTSMLLRMGVGGVGTVERVAVLLLIFASTVGALLLTARLFAHRVAHGHAIRRKYAARP